MPSVFDQLPPIVLFGFSLSLLVGGFYYFCLPFRTGTMRDNKNVGYLIMGYIGLLCGVYVGFIALLG